MNLKYIKILTVLLLLSIIVIQVVWIVNMYRSNVETLSVSMESSLDYAISSELTFRQKDIGGFAFYSTNHVGQDTARYIERTVMTEDSSFQIRIDRYDSKSSEKVLQFLMKDYAPLNINRLDSIFRTHLHQSVKGVKDTYMEYIDLKTGEIKDATFQKKKGSSYLSSSTTPIDTFNTMGVKAYIDSPSYIIFKNMLSMLLLSIVLIALCTFSLLHLLRAFLAQKKEEKMRQDSIYSMTHEFKRPISGAVAQVSLIPYYLEQGKLDKVSQYAEGALLELNKLTKYTERIQRISNDDTGAFILEKSDIAIDVFFNLIESKYRGPSDKEINLSLNIETKVDVIRVDLLHMSNVMDNLIENAIKYSEGPLQINIVVSDYKNNLIIKVKDNGIGMSGIDLSNIFEKYYRSSNTFAKSKVGFGLGLTYCKHVVESHGGKISVKSKIGVGSEFTVSIPLV